MERKGNHESQPLALKQLTQIIGLRAQINPRVIITISGGSGSGKSTLTDKLCKIFPASAALHTDDYYIGKTRMLREMPHGEEANFDHPAAIDISQILNDLTRLANGEEILGARYDMMTMEPSRPEIIKPAPLIIVEGLVANSPKLREISNLTIVAKSTPSARLKHLIERDEIRKGFSAAATAEAFANKVEPSYEKYFAKDDVQAKFVIMRKEFTI